MGIGPSWRGAVPRSGAWPRRSCSPAPSRSARASCSWRSVPARRFRPDRLHVLGLRAHHDRRRVRPRHVGATRVVARELARRALLADRTESPLRRVHRPRRDRPARHRGGGIERLRLGQGRLARGETLRIGDYALTFRGLEERQGANATEVRAQLAVRRGDRDLGTVEAGKNAYTAERQVSNEVGIRSDPLTGEDPS